MTPRLFRSMARTKRLRASGIGDGPSAAARWMLELLQDPPDGGGPGGSSRPEAGVLWPRMVGT
ncbi:hypothetical protein [Synechococcus sp. SynAce01]|uniref:hypothetical protein n=1 Tax=Synechococcus sp. SynAce01 TaxID=1916956 RepID=UPI0013C53334|nr:hypothetical protein [Synechococcus sp. SynAce01]